MYEFFYKNDIIRVIIMTVTSNTSYHSAHQSCVTDDISKSKDINRSHLWSNSHVMKSFLNVPTMDNKAIKYCYTCRGKIRNYGITPLKANFSPSNHSTPKINSSKSFTETRTSGFLENSLDKTNHADKFIDRKTSLTDVSIANVEQTQYIPTISQHIDVSFRRKYISSQYDLCATDLSQRKLRKGLKGIGCIVNFSLTESPKKKRTQIQACSICMMIVAIVVISLILVNYTSLSFKHDANINSTILVPTENIDVNKSSSAIISLYTDIPTLIDTTEKKYILSSTAEPLKTSERNNTNISNVILKIRKNIKTYPKERNKSQESSTKKDFIISDLSQKFCSCQSTEVCMLDEINGTSVCQIALDIDDPTGCGGLCAMETEACQLVDRVRGVRVCRLLTQVTCSSDDWRCHNGFCIPHTERCDGSVQCYDRSDEMHCDCDLTKQFRCGHAISCFPNTKMCDGLIDCWDGYDELNCTTECPKDQFTCTDGQCILSSRFCDGFADCEDESDEPQGCDGDCGSHEVQCKNHRCIPRNVQCDGKDDCGDRSDELICS